MEYMLSWANCSQASAVTRLLMFFVSIGFSSKSRGQLLA